MIDSTDTKYYVYAYLDPRKPGYFNYENFLFGYEPFYIGKGSGYRYKEHLWNKSSGCCTTSKFCLRKINKIRREINLEPIVIKVQINLTSEEAFNLEIKLIKLIGRADLKTGPLCNHTDGGSNGSYNMVPRNWTKSQREKLMSIRKNKPPMLGKKQSEDTKLKQSIAKKGKPLTMEHKKALSGREFTEDHKNKLASKKNKTIFCYDANSNEKLNQTYINAFDMADKLNISYHKCYKLLRSGKSFNGIFFKH